MKRLIEDNIFETATDTCSDILYWIYLATKGKINSIPIVGCSVKEVRLHFKMLEKMINVNKTKKDTTKEDIAYSIQRPLEMIAASSSSTQDFLSKLTQIQSSAQEKSSNSFTKLSDKVQRMMLIASSRGSVIPTALNEEAQAFSSLQISRRFSSFSKVIRNHQV